MCRSARCGRRAAGPRRRGGSTSLSIGAAQADITPSKRVPLLGHWHLRLSKGIETPLTASADPVALDQACADLCCAATPLPNTMLTEQPPHDDHFCALDPLLKLKRVKLTRHAPHDFEIAFNASQVFAKIFPVLCVLAFAGAFIFYGVQMVKNQEHTTSSSFFFNNFMWIGIITFAVLPTLATLTAISRGIRCDTLNRTFTVWWQIGTFPRKERVIAFDYTASFDTKVVASVDDVPTHYTVHPRTLGGDKHTVTKMIKGHQPTQALTRFLNAQMGKEGE